MRELCGPFGGFRIRTEQGWAYEGEWDVEWDACDIVHTGSSVRGYAKLPIRVG